VGPTEARLKADLSRTGLTIVIERRNGALAVGRQIGDYALLAKIAILLIEGL
jgi:hypothetical protein